MKKKVVLSVAVVLLIVMVAVMCVACTPTQKSVIKKFENKDYKVVGNEDSKVINCTKLSDAQSIIITWYDNEDDAKKAEELALKTNSKETVKRKGNAVGVGTKDAVKLF